MCEVTPWGWKPPQDWKHQGQDQDQDHDQQLDQDPEDGYPVGQAWLPSQSISSSVQPEVCSVFGFFMSDNL